MNYSTRFRNIAWVLLLTCAALTRCAGGDDLSDGDTCPLPSSNYYEADCYYKESGQVFPARLRRTLGSEIFLDGSTITPVGFASIAVGSIAESCRDNDSGSPFGGASEFEVACLAVGVPADCDDCGGTFPDGECYCEFDYGQGGKGRASVFIEIVEIESSRAFIVAGGVPVVVAGEVAVAGMFENRPWQPVRVEIVDSVGRFHAVRVYASTNCVAAASGSFEAADELRLLDYSTCEWSEDFAESWIYVGDVQTPMELDPAIVATCQQRAGEVLECYDVSITSD